MKKYRKLISVIVIATIILGCIPLGVFATEGDIHDIEVPLTPEPKITEDIERREESIKHFKLPDGSYDAISYAGAVHRKDENGIWQDIDNNLSIKTVGTKQLYTTNDSRLSFAKSYSSGENIMELRENGYVISMALLSEQNGDMSMDMNATASLATVVNSDYVRPDSFDSIEQAIEIDNRVSVTYSSVINNTDIEYVINGNDIKENIIVRERADSYVYAFRLSLDGLIPVLDESGAIYLNDSETEETIYVIPAPYMYDANDEYSEDVYYELFHVEGDKYLLTVTADESWINDEERAFPVTVDPSVIYSGSTAKDTYISSTNKDFAYGIHPQIWVGANDIGLIHIPLPNIHTSTNAGVFSYAELYISYYSMAVYGATTVSTHKILETWSESTATYNNAPEIDATVMSYNTLNTSQGYDFDDLHFGIINITNATQYYYDSGLPYYGVALKRHNGGHIIIKSREAGAADEAYILVGYEAIDVENGTYLIQNKQTGAALQIDDADAVTDFSTWCAPIEAHNLTQDPQKHQLWRIEYYGEGYFMVISEYSDMYLAVRKSQVNVSGPALVQITEPLTDKKLWKISKSVNGNYIFRPMSAEAFDTDWCMALENTTPGNIVTQKAYYNNPNNPNFEDEWTLTPISWIPDGVYALRSKYVNTTWISVGDNPTPYNNSAYGVSSSSLPATATFHDPARLFKITRVGDTQRYIIRLYSNPGLCLEIDGGGPKISAISSDDSEVPDSQTIFIEPSGSGYLLRQYGSDYVLCLSSASNTMLTSGLQSSVSLTPRASWELFEYSVTLYGIPDSYDVTDPKDKNVTHDHESVFESGVIPNITNSVPWANIKYKYRSVTATTCMNDLKETNVFIIRSHGVASPIGSNTPDATAIQLTDTAIALDRQYLYSHYSPSINSTDSIIEDSGDFSNLDLALFIGCETGAGGKEGNNLPAQIVEQGAKAAIGFKKVIFCDDANIWLNEFFHCMNSVTTTYTLKEAVSEACSESGISIYDITICIQNDQEDIVLW